MILHDTDCIPETAPPMRIPLPVTDKSKDVSCSTCYLWTTAWQICFSWCAITLFLLFPLLQASTAHQRFHAGHSENNSSHAAIFTVAAHFSLEVLQPSPFKSRVLYTLELPPWSVTASLSCWLCIRAHQGHCLPHTLLCPSRAWSWCVRLLVLQTFPLPITI